VIVNWNTREILSDCLKSIYEQTSGIEYEVIVIDNASDDSSGEMVKEMFPNVNLIENLENRGFAAANNQGIAVAKGRYVLLLNSDTIIMENAVAKVIEFADSRTDCGVTGCRVLNPDKTLQQTCFMFPSVLNMFLSSTYLYKIFPKSKFFGRERMTWWDRNDTRQVDVVTGCFLLVRREVIEQTGTLDEQFFVYGEETDFCFRAKKAGWKILFTPVAQIIHIGGASSRQTTPEMTLQLRGSLLLFMKKHRNRMIYSVACFLVAMFFFVRVPYWLVRSLFSNDATRTELCTARTYFAGTLKALFGAERLCV
jgi:GT2 family glycosyltransferase